MNSEKKTSFAFKLEDEKIEKLREYFKEHGRGFAVSPAPYVQWASREEDFSVSAFTSGKVCFQGKGAFDFITFTLEPVILEQLVLDYSEATIQESFVPHAGIDESGKGDLFGPLVVSAVFLDGDSAKKLLACGVKDSKLIKNEKTIHRLAGEIRTKSGGKYSIVAIGPSAYNNLYEKIGNLNRLLAWGHARALENLVEKAPECKEAVADKFGDERLILNALMKKGKKIKLKQRVRAESDVAVAAASILARSEFVRRLSFLGDPFEVKLPKGAGDAADTIASQIFAAHGAEKLATVAKRHFKNFAKATGLSPDLKDLCS